MSTPLIPEVDTQPPERPADSPGMHLEDRAAWFVASLMLAVFGVVHLDELAELLAEVAPMASA